MHGAWAGKTIAPHIGGSSDHVAMLSGKAYWDDLILDYGDIADPDMDITWISISDPGVPDHEGFDGQMSKYETTNAQFAYYLNRAIETGDIIVDGSYVKGAIGWNSGQDFTGQNYYDLAGSGTTYNGATNGGAARIHWMGSSFTVDSGFENHPVTYVSWYGAKAFASYFGWRLPTEWEWQAVADYNGTFNYGCGTTLNNDIANYRNSVHPDGTTVVGALGTYGFGVCDMAGNVFEWTDSCYYANCDGNYRVLRGGSWAFYDYYCSVSYRYYYNPFGLGISFGFRVCR